jgi:hypothetical protein
MLRSCAFLAAALASGAAHTQTITETPQRDSFPLVANGQPATIRIDGNPAKVVRIAAQLFQDDIQKVTGLTKGPSDATVLVGTLGASPLLDSLAKRGKIDLKNVQGRWEAYTITRVTDAQTGLKDALVIVGADRRGTAYGLLSLSEAIGVSPWNWWADVPAARKKALYLSLPKPLVDAPAVKYRGIFINDEDWGMQPWAAKTLEPETKDIGPKTYAKVFELLLRLKANYIWPAMHPSTKAFNLYPQNKFVADDYAIVMGSSHAEPMLRNNVTEWDEKKRGPFDYSKNRARVAKYWEERVAENGKFENVYTMGMRGIHDSGMQGGGTTQDKVARLETIFDDQRAMLARYVAPDPAKVSQIFVPYKEVLPLYEAGLHVPDDITLVWPDDNYGYVRHYPSEVEKARSGGSGVYYHASYWGEPNDYLWLCSTPPALIWEEMRKAYDNGVKSVWVLNVGDLKPAEIDIDFFLRLAWNPQSYDRDAQPRFLKDWATRTFGPSTADEIAAILTEYYHLGFDAKPEFAYKTMFMPRWPNEADGRLKRYADLVTRTNRLYDALPASAKDAAYELLVYSVRCAAAMNVKVANGRICRLYRAASKTAEADQAAERAKQAYQAILDETRYYNETLAGGKWRWMMSDKPRGHSEYGPPDLTSPLPKIELPPKGARISIPASNPTRNITQNGASWLPIADLGHRGDAMAVFPTTAHGIDPKDLKTQSPALEYAFTLDYTGPVQVLAECLPTFPTDPKRGLRYAVAIDDETPQLFDLATKEYAPNWADRVLRAQAVGRTEHRLLTKGAHTLRVWMVDPGVVFDRFTIGDGKLEPTGIYD